MRVGITFDLIEDYRSLGLGEEETAEFDSIETVEAIEEALCAEGFETERIGGIMNLVRSVARGKTWGIVFNIAEGLNGPGREAQVPALLDACSVPYTFSDPVVLGLTLHKGLTKHVLRDYGISTAPFAVAENAEDLYTVKLEFPLFLKPVSEGTGKGISVLSIVYDRQSLLSIGKGILERFRQPVLVERYLPGREFTVGILGTGSSAEVLPVMEILFQKGADCDVYSYRNKKHYKEAVKYRLIEDEQAEECRSLALKTWQCLGCRDGGRIDIRLDADGVPNVMEINPLPGLHPVDSDLPISCKHAGIGYQALIGRIMKSALERTNGPRPFRRIV